MIVEKQGQIVKTVLTMKRKIRSKLIQELMRLVKNMEINQTNYANDVRTLCTHLEKRNKEMQIMQNQHAKEIEAMKTNHDTEISFMQSKLSGLEENMTNMQANHKEKINSMQYCLMTIKEKNDKVIKDMEENHAREISAIKVEHSSQMDAIKIQFQKFQQQSEDERNRGMSIDQKPLYLLQQAPSCYEVLCSIENCFDEREINNQIDTHMVNPPVIEDQVITHGTCEIGPSSLAGQMQNEEIHVTHILHTSSESFEAESSMPSVIRPSKKKKRQRKRTRRRFDASDDREQLDFQIGKSSTICRIGHGTSY